MVSRKHRRLLQDRRKRRIRTKTPDKEPAKKNSRRKGIDKIYHDKYKLLFFITIGLVAFSLITIGLTYTQTGSLFYKGVSLSGGLTLTIATEGTPQDVAALETTLENTFPEADFAVREIGELGTQVGISIEASTLTNSQESLDELETSIIEIMEARLPKVESSSEIVGPSLGQAFFQQTAKAVLIAFAFMGMVVFIYFGNKNSHKVAVCALTVLEAILIWFSGNIIIAILAAIVGIVLLVIYSKLSIPSAAVILAAVSTILFTLAVVDVMKMRISTAGIAAFLMLIGYSVDTDILLSTRVLKRSGGSVYDRVLNAMKTGLTMTGTTLAASVIALLFTKSAVIKEIMIIIVIGLVADLFFTWIQNAGLLRLYLEDSNE